MALLTTLLRMLPSIAATPTTAAKCKTQGLAEGQCQTSKLGSARHRNHRGVSSSLPDAAANSGLVHACRGLRCLFGDQTLFCRAAAFRAVQGFDERLPIMEDADLCLRLHLAGIPLGQASNIRKRRCQQETQKITLTVLILAFCVN